MTTCKENNTKQWDDVWHSIDHRRIDQYEQLWYNYLRVFYFHHLLVPSVILEAGCGTGLGIESFSKRGHTAIGLDISREALKITKDLALGVNCVLGDIFHLPFRDNTFDLTFNSGVIEHFKEPLDGKALKEMTRVARRTGTVMTAVPNTLCVWYVVGKFVLKLARRFKWGFERSYSPKSLRKLLREVGLGEIAIEGLMPFPDFSVLKPLQQRSKSSFLCYALVARGTKAPQRAKAREDDS